MARNYLLRRGRLWHYNRRVPTEFRHLDGREFARVPLKTDSHDEAIKRAMAVNQATEEYWADLEGAQSEQAQERYQAALKMARRFGLSYIKATEIADSMPTDELLERIAIMRGRENDFATMAAVFGGADEPELTLSQPLKKFPDLVPEKLKGKNADQAKRWHNPRRRAVRNFISVVGDKPLSKVTRDDALVFRDWWYRRIEDEGMTENSANKDIGYVRQIFMTTKDRLRLPLPADPFERLFFSERRAVGRKPLDRDFVQSVLIDGDELEGLPLQAVAVVWVMASTGARVGEVCGLLPDDIELSGPVPFVRFRPNAVRSLKTHYSTRDIPLCGSALAALQAFPDGLTHYLGRADAASTEINKFFRERSVLPSDLHSLYSLRHTFQDQLVALECGDRVQCDLMGHRFNRPLYGAGATLEHKRDWVARCAFFPRAGSLLPP